jgi:hypothetical protein
MHFWSCLPTTTDTVASLSFSTIGGWQAVLYRGKIKLRLRLSQESLQHFEIEERPSNVCAVRDNVHRLQCCEWQDDARKDSALLAQTAALNTRRSFNRDLESF